MKAPEDDIEIDVLCPECGQKDQITIPGINHADDNVKEAYDSGKKISFSAIVICKGCGLPLIMGKGNKFSLMPQENLEEMPDEIRDKIIYECGKIMQEKGIMKQGKDGKHFYTESGPPKPADKTRYYARAGNPVIKEGSVILMRDKDEYQEFLCDIHNKSAEIAKKFYEFTQAIKEVEQNVEMN
jgi:hypothetical protein